MSGTPGTYYTSDRARDLFALVRELIAERGEQMAKVYVAGCLERVLDARALAAELRGAGFGVTSRWHDADVSREMEHRMGPADHAALAQGNLRDLAAADSVVWLADPRGRGSLVELGFATGRGHAVVAIGVQAGHTAMLAGATWVPDAAAALAALRGARSPLGSVADVAASVALRTYLALERAMLELDELDEPAADAVRDLMEPLWLALSDAERARLNGRAAPGWR